MAEGVSEVEKCDYYRHITDIQFFWESEGLCVA